MTTDAVQPEEHSSSSTGNQTAEASGGATGGSNGPRQKQSFRRRRKRRGAGVPGANPGQPQVAGVIQASTGAGTPAVNGAQPAAAGPGGQGSGENQVSRKKKKKFFKKNKGFQQNANGGQQNGAQPGVGGQPGGGQQNRVPRGDNRGNLQAQPRRGGKQQRRGPKTFVGPMDHSYRAVNGNFADAPPSTIELQRGFGGHYGGNGHGAPNFNINYNVELNTPGNMRTFDEVAAVSLAAMDESAPVRIYCFIDELFFIAKIQETAKKLGIKVAFVKNEKDTVADLLALSEEERPALIVVDLNNANAKPLTLIPKLKTKLKRATSIIGFLSHLQGELKAKAIEAGCDTVMPRSAFSQTLPNLLRRYGMEAEPETDDSQVQILEA